MQAWELYVGERKGYSLDFVNRLAGEIIAGDPVPTVTIGNGITAEDISIDGTKVKFRLTGGTKPGLTQVVVTLLTNNNDTLIGKKTILLIA